MVCASRDIDGQRVALLAEGVDRNVIGYNSPDYKTLVALLAEGVDRNFFGHLPSRRRVRVALLAEGVDRNTMRQSAAIP